MKEYGYIKNNITNLWDIIEFTGYDYENDFVVYKEGFQTMEECKEFIDTLGGAK